MFECFGEYVVKKKTLPATDVRFASTEFLLRRNYFWFVFKLYRRVEKWYTHENALARKY